ncbi:TIGR02677 family protein [Pseudonocardia sp.]|uniref:TIGR02677 family protein n=1 Tax=Pseudonocardia sp. TaxID=60912 RepID=UPI00262C35A4|nr:TIGR02677 family protein [Pseudonocardia sp.]
MPTHSAFTYLTVGKSELYRQVMLAFVAAKRRFTVHLRPEDVRDALGPGVDVDAVAAALVALEGWGNVASDPDTSRVTTVEDFHRARYLYQLTREGEAAEEALAVYDEALGRRGALQAVALTDIATQLRVLHELALSAEPDPAKVHLSLRALVDRFTDLAANAQAFMGSLQRSIDLHDADAEAFRAYKERLIDYLQRFITDLVATGSEIAALVARIEELGVDPLLDAAAWREAADAAPGAVGDGDDPRAVEFARRAALWRERWAGFRAWFVSAPQHPSQAKLLRSQARAAIPQLLHVVAALNDRRTGRSDRSADFRTLALWFAQAPDEASMHRLWRSAFGLSPSRHLTIDADTLAARADDPVPASTPWADAPPLEISPRLRRTGSYERRGKPSRVADRSAQRRHLAEVAAQEAAELAAARAALATEHPVRLSDVGTLDVDAFRLFLGLLGDALTALTPGRHEVTTSTSDGTMAVRLTVLPGAAPVRIHTPDGEFRGPDHLVHIVDLTAPARELTA